MITEICASVIMYTSYLQFKQKDANWFSIFLSSFTLLSYFYMILKYIYLVEYSNVSQIDHCDLAIRKYLLKGLNKSYMLSRNFRIFILLENIMIPLIII